METPIMYDKHLDADRSYEDFSSHSKRKSFITILPKVKQMDSKVSWVVCLCGFLANAIIVGCVYIHGVFFPYLLEEFGESKARTALAASLALGCMAILGPITSRISLRFGCRVGMVTSGLTSALALLASSFAPNIYVLYLTYGIFMGFSSSMIYVTGFQTIPLYFERHRCLATGILSTGPGAGVLLMSPVAQGLLNHLDWRKTLMILSGINLIPCLLGFTITRKDNYVDNDNNEDASKPLQTKKNSCNILRSMDFSLFKNPLFMIISISAALANLGIYTPYIHLAKYATEIGISRSGSTWMYFTIGIASMVNRVLTGKILDVGCNPLRLYQLAIIAFAIADCMVPLMNTFPLLIVFSLIAGLCDGMFASSINVTMLKSYPGMGFGWYMCFAGVCITTGPVLAGFISDVSGSYHPGFYTAAGILIFAAFLGEIPNWVKPNSKAEHYHVVEKEDMIIVEKETVI